jgi:2-keto-3-deoxy-L-rhamnonate aldolase RhmA
VNRLENAFQKSARKPLLGAAMYFYDPVFLEIAARVGFDVIWIEMEHAFLTYAQAADLCRMAYGRNLLTMIRIPDARRESVLKAAECGPDIIDLPMANSPQDIRDLLNNAKYPPVGRRGYFSPSRSLHYGLVDSVADEQQKLNEELSLIVQIETVEAVERIDELCSIPGVDIFIGPGDLSASLGVPGQTSHPKVGAAVRRTIEAAHRYNRRVATAVSQADASVWIDLGVDLLFCTNDVVCLRSGAQATFQHASALIEARAGKNKDNGQ